MKNWFSKLVRSNLSHLVAATLILILSLFVIFLHQTQIENIPTVQTLDANVTIDYESSIFTLSPLAIGMAETGYQQPYVLANDSLEQQRVRDLKLGSVRISLVYSMPGNTHSKIICGGSGCDIQPTGDQWIHAIRAVGAEPIVILNTTPITDAVNMVRHFSKDTSEPVKYWIIGNEPNLKGHSAREYSDYFNQNYDAMKAVDPTILIGGGATAWYDESWLRQFLQLSGSRVDFVDFHGYPQQGIIPGDIGMVFDWSAGIGADIRNLRSLIESIIPSRASQVFIEVGEWSLNWGGNAQGDSNFNAVWTADVLGNILRNGGISIYYGTKGNAIKWANGTNIDDHRVVHTMLLDDPKAPYHGYGMFTGESLFRRFGSTVVEAATTLPNVDVFASDNQKNIVVINKDRELARNAIFRLKGVLSGTIDVWRKDESIAFKDPPIHVETISLQNGIFTYTLPPMSATTFVLKESGND